MSSRTASARAHRAMLASSRTRIAALLAVAVMIFGCENPSHGPPPTQLAFGVVPHSTTADAMMTPAVTVMAMDANGDLASSFNGPVTLTIGANPGGATYGAIFAPCLQGACAPPLLTYTTVNAVAGVATFTNISVTKADNGYSLVAISGDLTPATSPLFSITPGVATRIANEGVLLVAGPASSTLTAPLSIALFDAASNPVPGATVNWALTGGGILSAPSSVTNAQGETSVTWTLSGTAGPQSATATVAGPTGVSATYNATATDYSLVSIVSSNVAACGLTAGGAAYCLGYNTFGRFGNGSADLSDLSPTPVAGGLAFASLTPAMFHSCGLTTGGVAYCWGANSTGGLGDGTTTQRLLPTAVAGGLVFASISAGFDYTCGLTPSGAAYCWGLNDFGQLGDSTNTNRLVPTPVAGGLMMTSVIAANDAACGLTTAGAVYCWGHTPAPLSGGIAFASIVAGADFNCGLTVSGAAYCWGHNERGQLGDGSLTQRDSPVPVQGGHSFTALTAGDYHACGLTADHTAYCWGDNGSGQLGDGTYVDRPSPVTSQAGRAFAALTAGHSEFTCGLTLASIVYCWGDFNGPVLTPPSNRVLPKSKHATSNR